MAEPAAPTRHAGRARALLPPPGKEGGETMNKLVPTAITSMSLLMLLGASPSQAAQCADVESAKMALRSTGLSSARGEGVQSPRDRQGTRQDGSLSGYRNQDVQSPR